MAISIKCSYLMRRPQGVVLRPAGPSPAALDELGIVVLADEAAVDQAVPVPRHQLIVTRHTREAFQVIHVSLRPHDELTGGYGLPA